jgi:hypothetical protein
VKAVGRCTSTSLSTTDFSAIDNGYSVAKNVYHSVKPSRVIVPASLDPTASTSDPLVDAAKNYGGNDYEYYGKDWKIRTQFTEETDIYSILEASARHQFASIQVSANQDLYFKPLNYRDFPVNKPAITFTESNILKSESIKTAFRDVDKIYRKFKFTLADGKTVRVFLENKSVTPSLKVEADFTRDDMDLFKRNLITELEGMFTFSKSLWDVNNENELDVDLTWAYSGDDKAWDAVYQLILRHCQFFVFNAWTISFETSMKHVVENVDLVNKPNRKLEVGDYVEFKTWFLTDNNPVRGFISKIGHTLYEGKISVEMYCPAPPEAYKEFYDNVWNAGIMTDSYDNTQYLYNGIINVYPFRNEEAVRNTYPSAPPLLDDVTDIENFTFTDNSFATHPPLE